jgi:hypothetical protein
MAYLVLLQALLYSRNVKYDQQQNENGLSLKIQANSF